MVMMFVLGTNSAQQNEPCLVWNIMLPALHTLQPQYHYKHVYNNIYHKVYMQMLEDLVQPKQYENF